MIRPILDIRIPVLLWINWCYFSAIIMTDNLVSKYNNVSLLASLCVEIICILCVYDFIMRIPAHVQAFLILLNIC